MFGIGYPIFVDNVLSSIDGSVVGLVIDNQYREISDDWATGSCVLSVRNTVPNPIEQEGQDALVLLDDKEPRPLLRTDPEATGDCTIKIPTV